MSLSSSASWIQPFAVGCVATLLATRAYSALRSETPSANSSKPVSCCAPTSTQPIPQAATPATPATPATSATTTTNPTPLKDSSNVQTNAWVVDSDSKARQASQVLPPGKVWGRRGEIENEKLTVDDWDTRWTRNQTGWHRNDVTPQLMKFIHTLRPATSNRPRRILVPLCGKSVDLIWLVNQGFQVVGIEFSVKAIVDFAREQRITSYKVTQTQPDIVRYDMLDGKLIILQCDIFSPNLTYICCDGFVDLIWDRNAFNAIHPSLRQNYMDVLLKLLRPHDQTIATYQDAKEQHNGTQPQQKGQAESYDFLLHVHDYDEKATSTTPYPCPASSISRTLSSAATHIITLDTHDVSHEAHMVNSSWWHHVLYGIRLK